MALINCPECGKEISDTSKKCIHCGYVLDNEGEKKKKILIIIAVVVVVIAIIVAIVASNSKGSSNKGSSSNSNNTSATTESSDSSEEATEETTGGGFAADEKQTTTFTRNQTIETEKSEFTLTGYEISSKIEPSNPPDYYHYYEADSGEVFIDVKFNIKNIATSSIAQDEVLDSVTVIYNDKYEYRCQFITVESDGDFNDYPSIYSINPLATMEYHMLTSIPSEAENSSESLVVQVEADGNIYECKLR